MNLRTSKKTRKLPRSFYNRPTLEVCRDLIGKYVVYNAGEGRCSARIVEVEAYIGKGDPACHAANGKTERNAVMFGKSGHAYVYFIYGMYHCLNFVTEKEGFPAAALLRGAEPCEGTDIMQANSPGCTGQKLLNGPGKICRSFGLTRQQNGLDLTGKILYLEDRHEPRPEIEVSRRIGVSQGKELMYRFCDKRSDAVSR